MKQSNGTYECNVLIEMKQPSSYSSVYLRANHNNYALAAILSQVESNGEIHLVTYLSQTFSDTELNYDTHDKELMAVTTLNNMSELSLYSRSVLSETLIVNSHHLSPMFQRSSGLMSFPKNAT
jgi:hypothetical protein